MKVDLLRQLDEWGTHVEASIDHIDADELVRSASETGQEAAPETKPVWYEKRSWSTPIRIAGVAAVVIVLAATVTRFLWEEVSMEFNSISGVNYVLQSSDSNLGNWQTISGSITGNGSRWVFTIPINVATDYFRIEASN